MTQAVTQSPAAPTYTLTGLINTTESWNTSLEDVKGCYWIPMKNFKQNTSADSLHMPSDPLTSNDSICLWSSVLPDRPTTHFKGQMKQLFTLEYAKNKIQHSQSEKAPFSAEHN